MTEIIAQSNRDEAALMELLNLAQLRARKDQAPTLLSISLELDFLEPLAVLESIWERSEWHAYFENVSEETAFAAAEAVDIATFEGSDRCVQAETWSQRIMSRCVEAGDTDHSMSGPQIMVGMTFEDQVVEGSPFAPLTVWIPRWQIYRNSEKTIAVANALIDSDSDLTGIAERMLRAHGRFKEFDYTGASLESADSQNFIQEEARKFDFTEGVESAVADIKQGLFKKIVLARSEVRKSDSDLNPIYPLARMREQFWGCHCFAFGNNQGTTFVGATPELLFQLKDNRVKTHALAGSISRGSNAREDAELGNALLQSEKDRHEQELVREAIVRRLETIGFKISTDQQTRLLKLKNIQHLNTQISGKSESPVSYWKILQTLHPTPAVGGSPREVALPRLRHYETLDRSLYTGAVGYVGKNGSGRAFVSIRSAAVSKNSLTLYAGAGIVDGSDPEKEWTETDLKMDAMRSIFEE